MDDTAQLAVITLKELSGVAVALEIWRSEMKKYRRNDELENFYPKELSVSLKTSFADLRVPTVIDAMIKEYVSIFGLSMENWLEQHYKRVLFFNYGHRNYILYDFDDFVCESNGAIDYVMTAKRMIRCDGLSKAKKFKIACAYFFEDDIRRLWPLVWKRVGLNNIDFHDFPQLYYWISCLRNEPNKIPSNELMFNNYMPRNGSSLEYFWNRMPSRLQKVKGELLYRQDVESFARYILPKLNDCHLNKFVNEKGAKLMDYLLRRRELGERFVLQTWLHIRNVMNEQNFRELVVKMFNIESRLFHVDGERDLKNCMYLCHEIWNTASDKLKRSVTRKMLFPSTSSSCICSSDIDNSSEFLLTVLSYAIFEERSSFWNKYWCGLIKSKSVADLQKIMKMCFAYDDDEIIQYKENVMAKSKHAHNVCVQSLSMGLFDELSDFVDFCYPNADSARNYKQQLLQSNLLGEESVFQLAFLTKAIQFNEFVCHAYNEADLATDFKNQLMLSPATQQRLLPEMAFSRNIQFNDLVKFVETLISTEQIMKRVKVLIIDIMKEYAIANKHFVASLRLESSFDPFLSWCFESDIEAIRFKETYISRTI